MDIDEKKYIAIVINYFSDSNMVTADIVNDHVAEVAYAALRGATMCSTAMDIVPRPTYTVPGIKYIVKQLVGIGKRIAEQNDGIYYICKLVTTAKFRTEMRLALIGR